jgi:hypothetical protein
MFLGRCGQVSQEEKSADRVPGAKPVNQNTENIIRHLNEYISIRFDHATRINPHLVHTKEDLIYHEMENVRRCLNSNKIYGPIRLMVSDVFMGDDQVKRRNLMSPSDQTSIQVELVSHVQDSKMEATRGQIKIHDLKTYYASINPELDEMMDLLETWIWWDIYDSVEIARFEHKLGIIQYVRQGKMSDKMRVKYTMLIRPPHETEEKPRPASDDEVILHEHARLVEIQENWSYRRKSEWGYMFVLKRDELEAPGQGEMIRRITEKIREYNSIKSMETDHGELLDPYAAVFKIPADQVHREQVLELVQNQLIQIERDMLCQVDRDTRLGPPYNFKSQQADFLDRWMKDLKAQLGPLMEQVEEELKKKQSQG